MGQAGLRITQARSACCAPYSADRPPLIKILKRLHLQKAITNVSNSPEGDRDDPRHHAEGACGPSLDLSIYDGFRGRLPAMSRSR